MDSVLMNIFEAAPPYQDDDVDDFIDDLDYQVFLGWIENLDAKFEEPYNDITTEEEKLHYVDSKLKGTARDQWLNYCEAHHPVINSWDEMKMFMTNCFRPRNYKHLEVLEFMKLTQGEMTVDEYTRLFYELAVKAKFPWVEHAMIIQFQRGLRKSLSLRLSLTRLHTMDQAVRAARMWEEIESKEPPTPSETTTDSISTTTSSTRTTTTTTSTTSTQRTATPSLHQTRGPRITDRVKEFSDDHDYKAFLNWMESLEEFLRDYHFTEEQKLSIVASKLKGTARVRWDEYDKTLDPAIGSWQQMKMAMTQFFRPPTYKKLEVSSFLQLGQGEMTVVEYTDLFYRLAAEAEVSWADHAMISQYLKGLNPVLHGKLSVTRLNTMPQAVNAACEWEEIMSKKSPLAPPPQTPVVKVVTPPANVVTPPPITPRVNVVTPPVSAGQGKLSIGTSKGIFYGKKIILKLDINDDRDKAKALRIVSKCPGVDSQHMDMREKKLTVTGFVDPINMTSRLRKKFHTDIMYIYSANDELRQAQGKKENNEKKTEAQGKKGNDEKKPEQTNQPYYYVNQNTYKDSPVNLSKPIVDKPPIGAGQEKIHVGAGQGKLPVGTSKGESLVKKIVLKLDIRDDKDKAKALKIVSNCPGVDFQHIDMREKKLTVTGLVDAIAMTSRLRKYFPADIINIYSANDEPRQAQGKKENDEKKHAQGKKENIENQNSQTDQVAQLIKSYIYRDTPGYDYNTLHHHYMYPRYYIPKP